MTAAMDIPQMLSITKINFDSQLTHVGKIGKSIF